MASNETNNIQKVNSAKPANSENAVSKPKNDNAQPTSTTRLTSFRVPRDLTLGGNIKTEKTKKVYAPNINVQRKKKGDADAAVTVKTEKDREGRQKHVREVKSKKPNNLIQSFGVFSEGGADKKRLSRGGGGYSRESSSNRSDSGSHMEKPKLSEIPSIDKAEEDERLRLLLRDDFIEENKEVVFKENTPILLPLNIPRSIYSESFLPAVQKPDSNTEVDEKPVIMENGEVKKFVPKYCKKMEGKVPSIVDILESSKNPNYIFMQFPTCLPIIGSDDPTPNVASKKQSSAETSENNKIKSSDCVLSNIKEGCIGKLQVLRSGKARIVLGGHKFQIERGTSTSYRQDLMAIHIKEEEKSADVVNLGPVHNTLIVSVDLESLLSET